MAGIVHFVKYQLYLVIKAPMQCKNRVEQLLQSIIVILYFNYKHL